MGVSKVIKADGTVLVDFTKDTITSDVILKGYTGHNAAGELITGTKEFKTQSKSVTPSKSSQSVTPDSGYDGLSLVTVNAIPSNYIDTTDADAGAYDVYYNKIAYIDGQKITGAYRVEGRTGGHQINSSSTNCSTSQLIIPCAFAPTHVCVILNDGTYNTNTVIAAMCQNGAVTFHSRTSSGVARNQYTSSTENYFSYDSTNKRVIIKRPTTSYNWSSRNYRYFCFK